MQLVKFLVIVTLLFTVFSMALAHANLIASSDEDEEEDGDDTRETSRDEDDDDNDNAPAHTGERVFDGERRVTQSAPQSSNAPVEVKTSIESDEEDRSDDPAHTGKIVFKDEDGEVVKEITQESAPQSSGSIVILDHDLETDHDRGVFLSNIGSSGETD